MWLDKATMSTGNNNITGLHVVQRPQDRGAKYFSITCPFPTTLIHMHPFISSAVDTPLGIRRRVYLQDEQAKRLLHAKSIPRGRLSLYSRDPEAKKPSLFTHMNRPLLRPCEIGSCNALVIRTRVEVAVRPPPLLP